MYGVIVSAMMEKSFMTCTLVQTAKKTMKLITTTMSTALSAASVWIGVRHEYRVRKMQGD